MRHTNEKREPKLGWPPEARERAPHALCIWYSPWQHQNEDNPLVPLIREIQAQFSTWQKLKEKAKGINRESGLAAAKLLEHLTDAAAGLMLGRHVQLARGLTDAMRQGYQAQEDRLTTLSDGQRFHLLFEDAVEQVLKARSNTRRLADAARLLIFIDDLDRCEGEVIVRLLEIIKLYLGTRRCVFILGLDDHAVLEALRKHRSDSEEGNREYLEKLFQAMLGVPLPLTAQVRQSIVEQLRLHIIPQPLDAEDARAQIAADIEGLLEPNPRKIKNFVNSLCAAWAMQGGDWLATDPDFPREARRFVLLQYLRHFHRAVWRLLERQPWAIGLLVQVLSGASGTEPGAAEGPYSFDEQGLMREVFFRAFSHVLRSTGDIADRHGNESLDEVVKRFHERRDRKRSDDHFRTMLLDLFKAEQEIDRRHIYLEVEAAPPAPGAPNP